MFRFSKGKRIIYGALKMTKILFFSVLTLLRPGPRQIDACCVKIYSIFERFTAVAPYFMTFSFQVLRASSKKIRAGRPLLGALALYSSRSWLKIQT